MSTGAQSLIGRLLDRESLSRLGSNGDELEVKDSPFWNGIDWEKIYQKEYQAPWIPPKGGRLGEFFDKNATSQPLYSMQASSPPSFIPRQPGRAHTLFPAWCGMR